MHYVLFYGIILQVETFYLQIPSFDINRWSCSQIVGRWIMWHNSDCYLLYALKISGICKWFEHLGFFEYSLFTYGIIWFVCQSFRQQKSLSLRLKRNPIPYRRPQWRNLQPWVKRRNKVSKFQAQRRAYDIVDMPLIRLSHCSTVALTGFNILFISNVD